MTRAERLRVIQAELGPELTEQYHELIAASARMRRAPSSTVKAVRAMARELSQIEAGRCPRCGQPVARYGSRETAALRSSVGLGAGPRIEPVGAWVMYRCSTQPPPGTQRGPDVCDFMLDRWEATEAN